MEIITELSAESAELKLRGRLDASWCEHVSTAISASIQNGSHRIFLNMNEVNYMSSAGIRVLMTFYKQLKHINGEFLVVSPSPEVKAVLELSGLNKLLANLSAAENLAPSVKTAATGGLSTTEDSRFESFNLGVKNPIALRLIGDTSDGFLSGVKQGSSVPISFGEQMFGLGLGAIGDNHDECKGRFGEFLSIAGTAAFLPTDHASKPDYMLTEGNLIPKLRVVYGLMGDLSFNILLRFGNRANETVGLSAMAEVVLKTLNVDTAIMAVVAETSALVGVALRESPSTETVEQTFNFPDIRKRLTFTAERAYQKSVSLVLGLVTRKTCINIEPMVRPLNIEKRLFGHFHAAAFSYAPIKKGQIDLTQTVRGLYDNQSLLGILHLLNDNRESNGVGESEFVRGACWCAPALLV